MKPFIKYYLHLFIYLQFAFIYANASDNSRMLFNNQYIYVSPNTQVYTELRVLEIEYLQDNICYNVFVFLPKNTLNTTKNTAKTLNKTAEFKIQLTKKLKNKAKQIFVNSYSSSNSLFNLRTSNKLCVIPISNIDFKYISKENVIVWVTQTIKNIQQQKTYENPTLGLFLQNTTPVFNKPPPFI
jgi:hypothetical protein